ncbi:hypothetical protein LCGC14_0791750 [marine sediment metagenome]|uniref:Uncharacterized protein n=1 Tax=marine sediment metagenome TaxID=412755 RepID=A0A0F9SZE5_9ZZZZ
MELKKEFLSKLGNYKVISIIGLAKNVSKTTTLNFIIKNLKDYKLGLTSIGRDGEKYDVITRFPKPRIFIKKGTIIATARQSYERSKIKMKLLKTTEYNTPLGEILILKALGDGFIELAGPSINKYLQEVCLELKGLDCDLILIDGAFDRRSYATPIISDATILSTGASVSENLQNVINLTIHTIELLNLNSEKNQRIIEIAKNILSKSKIGIIESQNSIVLLDVLTSLDSAKEISANLTENSKYVVIKGAITDKLLEDLMKKSNKCRGVTFLVEDATKLFLNKKIKDKFQKKGGFLKVLTPMNIIAITINPTSPYGYNFNKNDFLNLLKEKTNIPVYDLGVDNRFC